MCGEREVHGEDVLVKEAAALFRKKRKWSNVVRLVHAAYGDQARYITPVYFTCEAEDEFNSVKILRVVRMR
jgi:hypothetical protein